MSPPKSHQNRVLGRPGGVLGASWKRLGGICGHLGNILGGLVGASGVPGQPSGSPSEGPGGLVPILRAVPPSVPAQAYISSLETLDALFFASDF